MTLTRRAIFFSMLATTGFLAACTQQQQSQPAAGTTDPVYFDTGSAVMHANDHDTIRGVASMMASNPALTATVIGAADTVGSADYNAQLSQKRAQAVVNELVTVNKVPQNRVSARSVGESQLPVPTADSKPELMNRTVYIFLR